MLKGGLQMRRAFTKGILVAALSTTMMVPVSGAMAEAVKIRFMDRTTATEQAAYSKWLADTFNKAHEGEIEVIWEGVPDEAYKTKIFTVLRSPNPPDVFYSWEGGRAKFLIDSGFAAQLDPYYEKYGWKEIMNPSGVQLATFDGHQYFIPTMMAAAVLWYRPDVLAEHGLEAPKTWAEAMAAADTLKDAGITPFILANQMRWPAQFMWSALFVNKYGVAAYDDLIARCLAWTDPKVVDAFQIMKDLMNGNYFETGANGIDINPAVVPFSKGEAAMWYQGSFMTGRFLDNDGVPKFPLDYTTFPAVGDQTPTVSVFAENTLMMLAQSEHKDAAAEFLDWVLSVESQTRQSNDGKLLFPANVNVSLDNFDPLMQRLGATIAAAQDATFMHVDHAVPDSLADPFLDGLQSVLVGVMTPEQAAEQVEAAAQEAQGSVN